MAGRTDGGGRPDPDAARTAEEFVDALRRLKSWAGVGFRRLEKRAAAVGEALPRSTVTAALSRATLPREDLVTTLARTCGCDEDEVRRWLNARRRLAAGSRSPASPAAVAPVTDAQPVSLRCTLPAAQAVFVGRDKELAQITTAIEDAAQGGGVIAIHAFDGMPGIGKTTLAVHVAHRLKNRFSDRQLFVDLHAHTPGRPPTDPNDALAELLAADGGDNHSLPDSLDARAAVWRARMSDKRLLLILDNAFSTEQVLPLLPGAPDCLVLVTSRRSLGDLPAAAPISLGVLAPDEAVTMFIGLAPRAATDPEVVASLTRTCGYLPLAIAIAANMYLRHRSWSIADLLGEMQRSVARLLTMTPEDRTVAAAFDLSYHRLSPDRQRFFRLLGLHPGVDVDAYAAAALAAIPVDAAAAHLDGLHADHLLEEPAYRRYLMHDLIRAYTHALAINIDPADLREKALHRLLDFYRHTATGADACLSRYPRPTGDGTVDASVAVPELTTEEQAAAWLRAERPNLLACINHATGTGQDARAVGLTAAIAALLRADGPWIQAIHLHDIAAASADRLGDRLAHATAMHDQAIARWLAGDYPTAADLLDQALHRYRALDNRLGEANTLYQLAVVRRLTGDYPAAADLLGQALHLYQTLDNRLGQANARHDLGAVRWQGGDYPAAAELLDQALSLYKALGNRLGQATALYQLGIVRLLAGDYPAASDLLDQALSLYMALGNRLGQANTINDLGVVRRLTADYPAAAELHQQALALYRALGDPHNEAIASTHLAVVMYLTGDFSGAADLLHESLTVFRDVGAPDDETEALNHLATVHRLTADYDQANLVYREALDVARRIHHRLEEAHALDGIGRTALHHGDTASALVQLQQALDIYQQLGVPEATQLAAELTALTTGHRPVS
jgi:tetratricopeptide (TPR) repeat protein